MVLSDFEAFEGIFLFKVVFDELNVGLEKISADADETCVKVWRDWYGWAVVVLVVPIVAVATKIEKIVLKMF